MQPAIDARMWGEFLIRQACRPVYGFKFWALGTPSMNTIAKRLFQIDAAMVDEVELMKRDVNHQMLIYKAGAVLDALR